MSFGYGIGDVVVVGKLAWTVYKSCKDAPASFGNISQEVIALEAVIRQFEEAFEGQVLSVIEQERLRSVGQGCKDVLQELQELVQKYEGLGSNAKLSFDRLKWGAAPVDDLRTRLMSNTLLLSAFLQTSPVVIKKHIRKILQEYREGKREGSIFSSVSADSLTADERIQWRAIRKELENSGLTLAVLDSNRDLIIECLTNALNSESIQNHAAVSTHEKKGNGRVLRSAVSNSEGFTADSIAESIFKASAEKEQKNLTRPTGVPLNILEGEMADLKPSSSSIQAQTKGNAVGKPLMAISTSGKVDKDTEFLEPPSRISFFRALRKLRPQPTAEVQKAVQISAMIDKRIMADQAARSRDVKILLLGAGESGKTTLLRQMRLLHTGNYSYDEREEFRQDIFSNLIIACKTIIDEMRDQEISLSNVESEKAAQIIEEAQHIDPDDAFSPECYAAIKTLKRDGGFQSMLERGHEFALYDNTTYYFGNLERLFKPRYIPNEQDIIRSRRRTSGIFVFRFNSEDEKFSAHVFDVGGCRSERKKWVPIFPGVHVMIFLAPIGGYDRCLVEDKFSNVMHESLMLFKSLMLLPCFHNSSIVLLFTKVEQLKDKLSQRPITHWWPEYEGDPQSTTDVIRYFSEKFLALNGKPQRRIAVDAVDLADKARVSQLIKDKLFIPRSDFFPS